MKAHVNDNCIGCGLCASCCPEVFQISDSGKAEASDGQIDASLESKVSEARDGCPAGAIETE